MLANQILKLLAVSIISIIAGISIGLSSAKLIYENKMDEAIKVGGFVYKTNVYEIKLRNPQGEPRNEK